MAGGAVPLFYAVELRVGNREPIYHIIALEGGASGWVWGGSWVLHSGPSSQIGCV